MEILNKYVGLLSFICALLLKLETSIQRNAEKLMCAFITFSLDCWSSLLSDCSKSSLKILQSIQNAAVHSVSLVLGLKLFFLIKLIIIRAYGVGSGDFE